MLGRSELDEALCVLVDELADSRQCIVSEPAKFESRVLELAQQFGKGVINIMGHLAQLVSVSPRFNPIRRQTILDELKLRGVGVSKPVRRCY